MAKVISVAGCGTPTPYAKKLLGNSMYLKGKNFIAAALLLRREGGHDYVVLHLLCQGIEIVFKSILLFSDYDRYKAGLKVYGHDLMRLSVDKLSEFNLSPLRPHLRTEIQQLNCLYAKHLLRYGSIIDIGIDPATIQSDLTLRWIGAVLRVAERELARTGGSP